MSAMAGLDLTEEDVKRIIDAAKQHGYDTPREYLVALIEANVVDDEAIDSEEDDDEYVRQSIKEGMKEALRGEGIPIKDFWASLDEE